MSVQFGSVVIAPMEPERGKVKERRAVVITSGKVMQDTGVATVVALSASVDNPRKGIDIPVPFHPSGKCATSCNKKSHAVCDGGTSSRLRSCGRWGRCRGRSSVGSSQVLKPSWPPKKQKFGSGCDPVPGNVQAQLVAAFKPKEETD